PDSFQHVNDPPSTDIGAGVTLPIVNDAKEKKNMICHARVASSPYVCRNRKQPLSSWSHLGPFSPIPPTMWHPAWFPAPRCCLTAGEKEGRRDCPKVALEPPPLTLSLPLISFF
ncbi:hypothetical protein A2U01_0047698, partial [Trifolium medium]|nr:hypothetical protein [Trifolium medium]